MMQKSIGPPDLSDLLAATRDIGTTCSACTHSQLTYSNALVCFARGFVSAFSVIVIFHHPRLSPSPNHRRIQIWTAEYIHMRSPRVRQHNRALHSLLERCFGRGNRNAITAASAGKVHAGKVESSVRKNGMGAEKLGSSF